MVNVNGIFIIVKDKEYVLDRIDCIVDKYRNLKSTSFKEYLSDFKTCCKSIEKLLNECFETRLHSVDRCKQFISNCLKANELTMIQKYRQDMGFMLADIYYIVKNSCPIKDYPSCKSMVELSKDEIISLAKDLVKSDVVKSCVCFALLGSKVGDVTRIEDIKNLYKRLKIDLESDIKEKGKISNELEKWLLDWFNAEIGYCNLALFKVGFNTGENVKEIVEIAKKNIEKFRNRNCSENNNCITIR